MIDAYIIVMKQQDEKDQQIIDRVLRNGRQADYALLVDCYRARLFAFVATMVTCREDAEEHSMTRSAVRSIHGFAVSPIGFVLTIYAGILAYGLKQTN